MIKSCFFCEFHEVKHEGEGQMSYCQKENFWCKFSKCIAKKALKRFLEAEGFKLDQHLSTV